MDTLEWPEGNWDKATIGSVVCTVYTDGQPYKPCVLCETGFTGVVYDHLYMVHSDAQARRRSIIAYNLFYCPASQEWQ